MNYKRDGKETLGEWGTLLNVLTYFRNCAHVLSKISQTLLDAPEKDRQTFEISPSLSHYHLKCVAPMPPLSARFHKQGRACYANVSITLRTAWA